MRRRTPPAISILLALAGTAAAQPAPTEEVAHYYKYTLPMDAVGIGLLVGGAVAEGPGGRDTELSERLMAGGALVSLLGTPVVHATRGYHRRAAGSFLMRGAFAIAGMVIGFASARCDDSREIVCGADRMGPGFLAGLVVASVTDAALMTEERKPAPGWSPRVGATAGGVSLGIAGSF